MTRLRVLSIVCGALLSAGVAAQSRPLPSFALIAADGSATTSVAMAPPDSAQGTPVPWIMVIGQSPCRSCPATLAALNSALTPDQASRLAIVLSTTSVAEAKGLMSLSANLAGAGWYRDEARAALATMAVSGAPVIVGLRGNTIHWTRNAAGLGAAELESVITSWIR
jgi:hypothetical protein